MVTGIRSSSESTVVIRLPLASKNWEEAMGAMSLVRILAVVNLATAKKAATERKPTSTRAIRAEKIVPPSFFRL